jgi:hypothetical protein
MSMADDDTDADSTAPTGDDREQDRPDDGDDGRTPEEQRDAPDDETPTTGEDAAATDPFTTDKRLVERLLEFNAEDWLVVVLLTALAVVAAASYMPLNTLIGGGDQPIDRSTNPYCLETRDAVEGNLSSQIPGDVECTCLAPTDPGDPTLGDKANNTYTLQCEYPDGRKQNFQIWVPNEEHRNMTDGEPRIRQQR